MAHSESILKLTERSVLLEGVQEQLDSDEIFQYFSEYISVSRVLILKRSEDRALLLSKLLDKPYNRTGDVVSLALLSYEVAKLSYDQVMVMVNWTRMKILLQRRNV